MSVWIIVVLALSLLCTQSTGVQYYYNIAHMTNTPAAVHWAINKGANAIQLDLTFDYSSGHPVIFRHSDDDKECDCTCNCPRGFYWYCNSSPESVCSVLREGVNGMYPCRAESSISDLLTAVASHTSIALVIINSKIRTDIMNYEKMQRAGEGVFETILTYLFNKGYGGRVFIESSGQSSAPYVKTIVKLLKHSPYESKTYFTIDEDNFPNAYHAIVESGTKRMVYNYGNSACTYKSFTIDSFMYSDTLLTSELVGMIFVWTVDIKSAMNMFLPYANGIVSNYPGLVKEFLEENGKELATQETHIPIQE